MPSLPSKAAPLLLLLPLLSCPAVSGRRRVGPGSYDAINFSRARDPSCKATENPGCNNLTGNCCPHDDGTWLACCSGGGSPGGSGGSGGPKKLTFYTYRATNGAMNATALTRWTFGFAGLSANMANAAGVLRYIHNEVIGRDVTPTARPPICKRKFGIDRIERFKVTMMNTQEVYNVQHGQFAPFVALDNEMCTVPNCQEMWDTYGYVVGCQEGNDAYPGAKWYSFPGACPSMPTGEKTPACILRDRGGSCPFPRGGKTCTYKYSLAGTVMLDELVGIKDYKEFCESGGVEFSGPNSNDDGVTIDFWKDYHNPERNKARTQVLLKYFEERRSFWSGLFRPPRLEEPPCDSFR